MRRLICIGLAWAVSLAVQADSSGPRLAAYYDQFLAICGDRVYEWEDDDRPRAVIDGIRQVGVGRHRRYALTHEGRLLTWFDADEPPTVVMEGVERFHAGRSGLFVVTTDRVLWHLAVQGVLGFGERLSEQPVQIADGVVSAAVGDSADYYVTTAGDLFVRGKAYRGQYGDGRLKSTEDFVRTADNVRQVVAHTGHALILKHDGTVWGTGGNIYGPLGEHGYGDKATRWGRIFDGAVAIATGSSHSLAIREDGSLWIWGRNEELTPRQVMTGVTAVAGSNRDTVAIGGGKLWRWRTGGQPEMVMECAG